MKKIYGTTAIILIMALFFAGCREHNDPSDNPTPEPEAPVLSTIQGGGAVAWRKPDGSIINGTATATSVRGNNSSDRTTAKVTVTNGFITAIELTFSNTGTGNAANAGPTGVYTGVGNHDIDVIINEYKRLNTWETSSSVRPDTGAPVNGGFDVFVPAVEREVDDDGNTLVEGSPVRIIGSGALWSRGIKYAVKQAVSDLAYGSIVKTDNQWRYNNVSINGTGRITYKGYMGSSGNGRIDYPYSDNHTVTVTLVNGKITKVHGAGSDYGCPYQAQMNPTNPNTTPTGPSPTATRLEAMETSMVEENTWDIDALSGSSLSQLYLRSAVYQAIREAARNPVIKE